MSYNSKNYTEQGGEVTHIGGKLVFDEGATVEGSEIPSSYVLPEADAETLGGVMIGAGFSVHDGVLALSEASAEAIGGVKLVANQGASTATTVAGLKEDFNVLLAALKAAGVMAADSAEPGE